MSQYTIRHEHLGAFPVIALIDSSTGTCVRVARHGATVLEYQAPVAGRLRNLVDGYAGADELQALHGSRFAIMLPFANRIEDARYHFDGTDHDLQPGTPMGKRGIMHGFVQSDEFDLLSTDLDDTGACVRLGCHTITPDTCAGYPFSLDLEIAYTLHAGGLDLEATMRNTGDTAAPCFFGWHPYLRLREDGIDACELKLPASQAIITDQAMIPLPGEDAFKPLDACPDLDFRQWRAIGDSVLDTGFADPAVDADGRIRSHVRDPESGLAVAVWQESGVTLVYTSDTLGDDAVRRSVAVEPMQSMTNAFNRPDCADDITLQPGAERRFRCGLEIHCP
ncbi:MAG TPA: aldose epimerase [Oleiagrimonas sp.]|nr:aldose epimerase [Oleiagrimonas sp.]